MLAISDAVGRPSATASAAAFATAVLTSAQKLTSARMCFSAWNEPIGRPNATRALAYSTVISTSRVIAPTDSAKVSATATSSCVSMLA